MKRNAILIAAIGAAATIIGVGLTIYFSPLQTCIRAQQQSAADAGQTLVPGWVEHYCSRVTK